MSGPKHGDHAVVIYSGSGKLHVATITKRVEHKHRDDLWDGAILCDARPRYYFRLAKDTKVGRCHHCFRRWKLAGSPPLIGFMPDDIPQVGDIELPWGWREVAPVGYEADSTPEEDDDPKVKEIRRFQRGQRIVRIAEVAPEHLDKYHRYSIEWARVGKEPKGTRYDADFKAQLKLATEWMWLGGAPRN